MTLSIPTKAFLDEEGLAELEKEMNPPAPVKDVVAKKKDAAKPRRPPKAEEEDLDVVEAGADGHIVTPVDDGGPGDGWAQAEAAEAAELVEKPLTKTRTSSPSSRSGPPATRASSIQTSSRTRRPRTTRTTATTTSSSRRRTRRWPGRPALAAPTRRRPPRRGLPETARPRRQRTPRSGWRRPLPSSVQLPDLERRRDGQRLGASSQLLRCVLCPESSTTCCACCSAFCGLCTMTSVFMELSISFGSFCYAS